MQVSFSVSLPLRISSVSQREKSLISISEIQLLNGEREPKITYPSGIRDTWHSRCPCGNCSVILNRIFPSLYDNNLTKRDILSKFEEIVHKCAAMGRVLPYTLTPIKIGNLLNVITWFGKDVNYAADLLYSRLNSDRDCDFCKSPLECSTLVELKGKTLTVLPKTVKPYGCKFINHRGGAPYFIYPNCFNISEFGTEGATCQTVFPNSGCDWAKDGMSDVHTVDKRRYNGIVTSLAKAFSPSATIYYHDYQDPVHMHFHMAEGHMKIEGCQSVSVFFCVILEDLRDIILAKRERGSLNVKRFPDVPLPVNSLTESDQNALYWSLYIQGNMMVPDLLLTYWNEIYCNRPNKHLNREVHKLMTLKPPKLTISKGVYELTKSYFNCYDFNIKNEGVADPVFNVNHARYQTIKNDTFYPITNNTTSNTKVMDMINVTDIIRNKLFPHHHIVLRGVFRREDYGVTDKFREMAEFIGCLDTNSVLGLGECPGNSMAIWKRATTKVIVAISTDRAFCDYVMDPRNHVTIHNYDLNRAPFKVGHFSLVTYDVMDDYDYWRQAYSAHSLALKGLMWVGINLAEHGSMIFKVMFGKLGGTDKLIKFVKQYFVDLYAYKSKMTDGNEEVYLLGRGYTGNMGILSLTEECLFGDQINAEIENLLYRSQYARMDMLLDINTNKQEYSFNFQNAKNLVFITYLTNKSPSQTRFKSTSPIAEALDIIRAQVASLVVGSCLDFGDDGDIKNYLPNIPYTSVSNNGTKRATIYMPSYETPYIIFEKFLTQSIVCIRSIHDLTDDDVIRVTRIRHNVIIFVVPDGEFIYNMEGLKIGWRDTDEYRCTYKDRGEVYKHTKSMLHLLELLGTNRTEIQPRRQHLDPLIDAVLKSLRVIVYK